MDSGVPKTEINSIFLGKYARMDFRTIKISPSWNVIIRNDFFKAEKNQCRIKTFIFLKMRTFEGFKNSFNRPKWSNEVRNIRSFESVYFPKIWRCYSGRALCVSTSWKGRLQITPHHNLYLDICSLYCTAYLLVCNVLQLTSMELQGFYGHETDASR